MNLKAGTQLQSGRYSIIGVMGQGGFGVTYEAIQNGLNRHVAIKEFFMKEYCERDQDTASVSVPSTGSRDLVENYKKKFIKEAQTIAQLDHANIIRIHDIFEENDTAYYVMKFVPNGSLKQKIEADEKMSTNTILDYIQQIGSALSYLHDKKIVHLDVKPSNVLLNEQGKAILIDFGVSKHYDRQGFQTSSTPTGVSKGFAPLEQYQGNIHSFTPASDIYSLGAVLYNMLTGKIPPEAHIVNEDGLPPFPKEIPAHLVKAVEHAMQPRRKDRPESVKAWLQELKTTELANTDILKEKEDLQKDEVSRETNAIKQNKINRNRVEQIRTNENSTQYIEPQKEKKTVSKKWLILIICGILLAISGWAIITYLLPHKTDEQKQEEKEITFTTALASIYNKESANDGLQMLKKLSQNGDGNASFLLSQLYFKSRLISDVCPDSILELKETCNIKEDNESALQYLQKAVEQTPKNYHATFELAYNYWKASGRTEAVPERDGAKAEHYFLLSRTNALKANDDIYIHKIDSILRLMEIWKENIEDIEKAQ